MMRDYFADVLMNLCSIIFSNVTPLTMADNEQTNYPRADITQHLHDVVK